MPGRGERREVLVPTGEGFFIGGEPIARDLNRSLGGCPRLPERPKGKRGRTGRLTQVRQQQ